MSKKKLLLFLLLAGKVPPLNTSFIGKPASVYVYGLQPQHTELTLYELFSPFGGVLNVKLIRDLTKENKSCKGYGFFNRN